MSVWRIQSENSDRWYTVDMDKGTLFLTERAGLD